MKFGYSEYDDAPTERAEWTKFFPSQVVAVVCHIMWCFGTEEAFGNAEDVVQAMSDWYDVNIG
jgi:hypothetical protein